MAGREFLESVCKFSFKEIMQAGGAYYDVIVHDPASDLPMPVSWKCDIPGRLRQEFGTGKAFKEDIDRTINGHYKELARLTVGCLGIAMCADVCSPGLFNHNEDDYLIGSYYFYGKVDVGNGDWEWADLGYADDLLVFHTDIKWLAPDWEEQLFTSMLRSLLTLVERQKSLSFHKIADSSWTGWCWI